MLKKYILLLMVLSFSYGYLVENVIERYENGYLKKVNYYERIFINGYENQILVKENNIIFQEHSPACGGGACLRPHLMSLPNKR